MLLKEHKLRCRFPSFRTTFFPANLQERSRKTGSIL